MANLPMNFFVKNKNQSNKKLHSLWQVPFGARQEKKFYGVRFRITLIQKLVQKLMLHIQNKEKPSTKMSEQPNPKA